MKLCQWILTVSASSETAAEEMTGFVPADGLPANPDNLHFSAAGLHAFGLRYYEVFRTLERRDKVFMEKPDRAFVGINISPNTR